MPNFSAFFSLYVVNPNECVQFYLDISLINAFHKDFTLLFTIIKIICVSSKLTNRIHEIYFNIYSVINHCPSVTPVTF